MIINTDYKLERNSWANNTPRSIIFHTTLGGGSMQGVFNTLKSRGLSYNYIIKQGVVYEIVPFQRSAWHAGVVHKPTMKARVFYRSMKGDENPNRHSVGIAFDKPQGDFSLSDADIDAAVELLKWIGSQTGIRYTPENIFYHREITSYKPLEVATYRELVVDALIGDKDEKDAHDISQKKLLIKYLLLQVQLLTLQLRLKRQST